MGLVVMTKASSGVEGTWWLRDDYPGDEIKTHIFAADSQWNIGQVTQWHNKWLLMLLSQAPKNIRSDRRHDWLLLTALHSTGLKY
jgi:hypothetical protein